MAAEHDKAKAPTMVGDENSQRSQHHRCAHKTQNAGSDGLKRFAEQITLLAMRGTGQRGKADQAQDESEQMAHSVAPPDATAMAAGRGALRLAEVLT